MINLMNVSRELAMFKMEPERQEREKRKALFVSVTELWQTEEDIDYSVSVTDLVELLNETPEFIHERMEAGDVMNKMSQSINQCRSISRTMRLL